jgi:Arc/MetJ family transcription regulator
MRCISLTENQASVKSATRDAVELSMRTPEVDTETLGFAKALSACWAAKRLCRKSNEQQLDY